MKFCHPASPTGDASLVRRPTTLSAAARRWCPTSLSRARGKHSPQCMGSLSGCTSTRSDVDSPPRHTVHTRRRSGSAPSRSGRCAMKRAGPCAQCRGSKWLRRALVEAGRAASPHQEQLLRRTIPTTRRPPRTQQIRPYCRPRHPHYRLLPAHPPRHLSRHQPHVSRRTPPRTVERRAVKQLQQRLPGCSHPTQLRRMSVFHLREQSRRDRGHAWASPP